MRQILDDNVKDDLVQIQKPLSKLNSTKVEEARKGEKLTSEEPKARRADKLTSEGPHPGERSVTVVVGRLTHFIILLIYFHLL